MTPPAAVAWPVGIDLPISPDAITKDLLSSLHAAPERPGLDPWELLRQVLSMAARAQSTIAVQRARIDYLEGLSLSDELTGLANRRGFERALSQALELAQRHGERGLLAFIDLDGFKAVNDSHGHGAGDAVLRRVADLLRHGVRASDVIARLGGDEFAVLLLRAAEAEAVERTDRLRRLLNDASVRYGGARIAIGASLGVRPFGPGDNAADLLRRADLAMYRDKRRRTAVRRGGLRLALASSRPA